MDENSHIFKLRFFDDNNTITPQSFNGKELGELIVSFYQGLKELIDVRYPEIDSNTINISVIGVENKSESLLWQTSGELQVNEALKEFANAVSGKRYADLPYSTYKTVKNIFSITKKKKCNAELIEKDNRLFIITPHDELIKQQNVLIKSDMLLYGILNKIGGDKPRAWVELYDGSRISFSITDEQLVQLRNRLKEPVAIKGKATWSIISKQVVYFKITEIIDYRPENIIEGFQNLSKLLKGWDSINDNSDIINFLKGKS